MLCWPRRRVFAPVAPFRMVLRDHRQFSVKLKKAPRFYLDLGSFNMARISPSREVLLRGVFQLLSGPDPSFLKFWASMLRSTRPTTTLRGPKLGSDGWPRMLESPMEHVADSRQPMVMRVMHQYQRSRDSFDYRLTRSLWNVLLFFSLRQGSSFLRACQFHRGACGLLNSHVP